MLTILVLNESLFGALEIEKNTNVSSFYALACGSAVGGGKSFFPDSLEQHHSSGRHK